MRIEEHTNWVAGRAQGPAEGHLFERVSHLAGGEPTGRWPRSTAEDLAEALEQTAAAAGDWRRRPRAERAALLRGLPAAIARQRDLAGSLGRALGLEVHELSSRLDADLLELARSLSANSAGAGEGPGDPGHGRGPQAAGEPGTGLFVAHWSDLVGGLAAGVCARLLDGAGVCVVSDPHLPEAAQALAGALAEVLGPGPWSIVHTDLAGPLAAATRWDSLAWIRWRAPSEVLRAARAERGTRPATWELLPVVNASYVIPEAADPAAEAALVVRQALGRSSTLSGQFPGQVGRIYCHQRLFSRFSLQLLHLLEDAPDQPVPLVEDDLFEHVRRAWTIGLDEGATPIFGGPPVRCTPLTLAPLVFTNVDVAGGLVDLERPAPILGLCRVASDAEGRRLAAARGGPSWRPDR